MRIHVKTLKGDYIFGALNIGRLTATNLVHINKFPVFKMSNGEQVTCSLEMLKRINDRLDINSIPK